jgi:hypothetical protein
MTTGEHQAIVGALRKKLVEAQLRLDEATALCNNLITIQEPVFDEAPGEYLEEPECIE